MNKAASQGVTHPTAASVHVAGSFNEWRPEVSPMIPVGDGRWAAILERVEANQTKAGGGN